MFMCPGCKQAHSVVGWQFNGNVDAPTFQPSVLVRSGHYVPGHEDQTKCWCAYKAEHPEDTDPFDCYLCHSFATDGQIQFLTDSTHKLAGQTVPLAEWADA